MVLIKKVGRAIKIVASRAHASNSATYEGVGRVCGVAANSYITNGYRRGIFQAIYAFSTS